jgi:hypothetical protein
MSKYLARDFLRTLDPKVYEKAAMMVEQAKNKSSLGFFCCNAIGAVLDDDGWGELHLAAFKAAFKPRTTKEELEHPFWDAGFLGDAHTPYAIRRWKRERLTALAMMSAMVKYAKEH